MVITKLSDCSYEIPNIKLWYLITGKLMILVEGENDIRIDNGGVDRNRLSIKSSNIGRARVVKCIIIDIITSKSKIFILFSFYFNIIILSKLII